MNSPLGLKFMRAINAYLDLAKHPENYTDEDAENIGANLARVLKEDVENSENRGK